MDRIAIISDIHGNISALNAVLDDISKRNVNKIFCLGDTMIKCTHPDLVIDKLRDVCDVMLIGNCDYAICRPEAKNKHFWSREKIGEDRANFIFNLPVSFEFYLSGHLIRLFHASPFDLDSIYNPMFSNVGTRYSGKELHSPDDLFRNTDFIGKSASDPVPDIIGYGHIHTPCIYRYKNKTIFNAGSVGIPVEMMNSDINDRSNKFSTLASYIIVEGFYDSKILDAISFQLIRLPYDLSKELADLENSDMPSPNKEIAINSLKGALPSNYEIV